MEVRRHRLRAQRLADTAASTPVEVVRHLVGVQAQDSRAVPLALAARGAEGPLDGIVRMWSIRGTLHLVAAEDVPLMLAIFAPLHLARGQRRLTELGLPPELAERSTEAAAEIVAERGPLTRHELAAALNERGVPVSPEGQAPIHVVRRAALAGVLIETGADRYGPAAPGPLPDRDDAVRELARRYAQSHAPATAADFAAWSGLPAADVKAAWTDPEPPRGEPEPGPVRLLPGFDEWLLGWASRAHALTAADEPRVARGGIIRAVAIDDGRVFATWRRKRGAIELEPLRRMTRAQREAAEAQASAYRGRPCASA